MGRTLKGYRHLVKNLLKLARADVVVVSHAKSGRTWLSVMISHVYHQMYGIDERKLVTQFYTFRGTQSAVPRIFFTTDRRKFHSRAGEPIASAKWFAKKKVILLVRDLRDIAVSNYFQGHHRHPGLAEGDDAARESLVQANGADNAQPPGFFEYIVNKRIPRILKFQKRWEQNLKQIEHHLVVRYEDLRAKPCDELMRIMEFIGGTYAPEVIEKAVDFASFNKLKAKEAEHFFETRRLQPGDPDDPNSFKVRRGKVGGYQDYLTPDQIAQIDAMIVDVKAEWLVTSSEKSGPENL